MCTFDDKEKHGISFFMALLLEKNFQLNLINNSFEKNARTMLLILSCIYIIGGITKNIKSSERSILLKNVYFQTIFSYKYNIQSFT